MPRASTCLPDGAPVEVGEALHRRNEARMRRQPRPDFRCLVCKQPVRPHAEGRQGAAHFEHLERNADCNLSDPERSR